MNRVLLAGCFILLSMSSTWAVTYVNKANSGTQDGHSWGTAWRSIQDGVDQVFAAGGGEVWVAAGTYTAATNPVLAMKEGVHIYGGFAGSETSKDQRYWNSNITYIDGENLRRCVVGANNATLDMFTVMRGYVLSGSGGSAYGGGMYNDAVSPTVCNCVFNGNSVRGGDGGSSKVGGLAAGGGLANVNNALPLVSYCAFVGNMATAGTGGTSAHLAGGAAYGAGMYGGASVIAYCTFTDNTATGGRGSEWGGNLCCLDGAAIGGGLYSDSAVVEHCSFISNRAYGGYGGDWIESSKQVSPKTWYTGGNGGPAQGGGAGCSSGTFTNCIFTGNTVTGGQGGIGHPLTVEGYGGSGGDAYGGGLYCSNTTTLTNCTFTENKATRGLRGTGWPNNAAHLGERDGAIGGGAIECANFTVNIKNCILWNDTIWNDPTGTHWFSEVHGDALITYSCVYGNGWDYGNIDTDPLFVGSPANLHLQPGSQCIDSGGATGAPSDDLEGIPRPQGPRYDMGAYEYYVPRTIPNLAGMTQSAAQSAILDAVLTVGTVTFVFSDTVKGGCVISQSPEADQQVPSGTPVSLVISNPIVGSIVINNNRSATNNPQVTLALTWSGGGGIGVTRMRFSDDGAHWTSWEPLATTCSHTLPSGDGHKTVRVQYRDALGGTSAAISDYIRLDTTPPTGTIIINGGASATVNLSVTLGLTWADGAGAGVTRMRFSDDGAHWSNWMIPEASHKYTLPVGLGYHTVRVQYLDGANNYSAVYNDYIKVVSP